MIKPIARAIWDDADDRRIMDNIDEDIREEIANHWDEFANNLPVWTEKLDKEDPVQDALLEAVRIRKAGLPLEGQMNLILDLVEDEE